MFILHVIRILFSFDDNMTKLPVFPKRIIHFTKAHDSIKSYNNGDFLSNFGLPHSLTDFLFLFLLLVMGLTVSDFINFKKF